MVNSTYERGFRFDSSNLSRNIENLDIRARRYISEDVDTHVRAGELSLKANAPWTQTGMKNRWGRTSTGHARGGLWAKGDMFNDHVQIDMGHIAEYGVYLEENYEKRFEIIMPTLIATAKSFMRSLENLFADMQTHVQPIPTIRPEGSRPSVAPTKPEVSVGGVRETVDKLGRKALRVGGRFISKIDAKRLDRNAKRRERYAVKKANGATASTKKTERG